MKNDYSRRLNRLKQRRTDENIQKAILTESFQKSELGESVKYALESMKGIDESYTENTFKSAENVQNNIESGLSQDGYEVEFRHQGSVTTKTHIKLHSDIDIILINNAFITLESPQEPSSPFKGDPHAEMKKLRETTFQNLDSIYKQVDNSKGKSIKVFPTNPKRKVDVVFANWYNSNEYVQNSYQEVYRGVNIYDYSNHTRSHDFPFLNIRNINNKGVQTNDNDKRAIRLLKTLKEDANYSIDLSSFEITSIVFGISNTSLAISELHQLKLLPVISNELEYLINNSTYRNSLLSPNGKEVVFPDNSKVIELKKLKQEVDDLYDDINTTLESSFLSVNKSIKY